MLSLHLRLSPESADRILIEQMQGRTDKTGQFVLDKAFQDMEKNRGSSEE